MQTPKTNSRDDDYANRPYIADAESYLDKWLEMAATFRRTANATLDIPYGSGERHKLDLFTPDLKQGQKPGQKPKGLVVFVHGGYWMAFDKSSWSHLAQGAISAGYAVAIPSYTLCPAVKISDITLEIARAIEHAAGLIEGEIHLAGHSAGGHLVSRMVSHTSPLNKLDKLNRSVLDRIKNVMSISGVHDLRPLLETEMSDTLHLDMDQAYLESPALLLPSPKCTASMTCWVGGDERPEFIRQNSLLATIWTGFGMPINAVVEPGKHHFNIIDGLLDRDHGLMKVLLKSAG
jgi:acetyl esterase/lipase